MASRTAYSTWTPQKTTLFSGHYLRNRSNLDRGVLGYIGIVQHKEHSPEVLSIPPGTPCIRTLSQAIHKCSWILKQRKEAKCSSCSCPINKRDETGHWLTSTEKRGPCKKPNCVGVPKVMCTKCKVYLCFTPSSNCFMEFHK